MTKFSLSTVLPVPALAAKPWLTHTAETEAVWRNAGMDDGIPYSAEAPCIRREFEQATRQEGGTFTMSVSLFEPKPVPA